MDTTGLHALGYFLVGLSSLFTFIFAAMTYGDLRRPHATSGLPTSTFEARQRGWVDVTGTVVEVVGYEARGGSIDFDDTATFHKPRIVYIIGETTHHIEGQVGTTRSDQWSVGQAVALLVDPQRPESARLYEDLVYESSDPGACGPLLGLLITASMTIGIAILFFWPR